MSRPTIALACICKNERQNFEPLFNSIKDCFDEIHITDTGSTDGSVEFLTEFVRTNQDKAVLGCSLTIHHFDWVDDFAAARNYSFSHVKSDFVMWLDLDDSLDNAEAFKLWRDNAMGLADYWLASYQYAFDDGGHPICSFARERVVRTSKKSAWHYFVHEGIRPVPGMIPQYAITWKVKHRRTLADIKKDHGRNLSLFEKNKAQLDSRMLFYYGKELFEAGRPMEAYAPLMDSITKKDLEPHDRLLGVQYATLSSIQCNQLDRAIALAYQGLGMDPNRAEFFVAIADCFLKKGDMKSAIPFLYAAKNCVNSAPSTAKYQGAVYNHELSYGAYPTETLAKIFYANADLERAKSLAIEGIEKFNSEPCRVLLVEIEKGQAKIRPDLSALIDTDEIVITTPPEGAYPWDAEIYKTKGLGGSETAAVQMAAWLAKKTKHKVIIFNPRKDFLTCDGVEYRPVSGALDYFAKYRPKTHIMWRHNIKISDAHSYAWCHDLVLQGAEYGLNADKILCLSEFHKNYVRAMQGIPEDRIVLTRNGVDPERFSKPVAKNPNKVIFPSSPDRGLDRAILIMDEARKTLPDLEFHIYYGFDNLEKYGQGELAKKLKTMVAERPWIKYHGNVDQQTLANEMLGAVLWLYPANFIESFCILAVETQLAGVYGLVREIGALQNTYRKAHEDGRGLLLDMNAETDVQRSVWAAHVVAAIQERRWEHCLVSEAEKKDFSWEKVADEWVSLMKLTPIWTLRDEINARTVSI